MGGPSNLDEVELFLKNMFNDINILSIKSDFLRSLLASFIVYRRKDEAKSNYRKIGGKSPINDITKSLVVKTQKYFESKQNNIYVTHCMRYTPPYASDIIKDLKNNSIEEVVLLPLYPQYSSTTTKSSIDDFVDEMNRAETVFEIKIINNFYKNRLFNSAIVDEIYNRVHQYDGKYNLIFSAHGLPQSIIDGGDVYEDEIKNHIEILKDDMLHKGMEFESISLAYQSKVGPMKWLEPSLETVLQRFDGKDVLIYPISFIIDNSETDYELSIEYKEVANKIGISRYEVCRCVNDNDTFIEAIEDIIF
jgi:ferrochelatase